MEDVVVPRWIRWAMALGLGGPQLATGAWALVAPRGFFDDFPGLGPSLVGAEPPYNRHLIMDVGGGFFATAVALVIGALMARRWPVVLALVTYLAYAVPHVIYHAAHEAPGLSSGEELFNVLLLASGVVLALVLLWFAWRSAEHRQPSESVGAGSVGSGGDSPLSTAERD